MSKLTHEILMEIRKENKLSRKALSFLSGFNEQTIFSYERKARKPSKEYIRFMSLYFNVSEDYINGVSEVNEAYTPFKRVLLMYQDIYNRTNGEMTDIINKRVIIKNNDFKSSESFKVVEDFPPIKIYNMSYLEILDTFHDDLSGSISVLKALNIKPSSIDFYLQKRFPNSIDDKSPFIKKVNDLEINGIKFDKEFYIENIKKRNLAKINYKPQVENKYLTARHQDILDLLPYAPEKFINDMYEKLKYFKNLEITVNGSRIIGD